MITWSADTSPVTEACSEITSMLLVSVLAETLPAISPSTRRPSVNLRLPSMRLPWAMRLLMGGGAFLPNMCVSSFAKVALQRDALRGAGDRTFDHPGGNVFYHGLLGQVDHAFDAPVLAKLQRPARHVHHPGLAAEGAGQLHLEPAPELGRVLHGLDQEHLPFQLRARQHFGLQPANGHGLPAAGGNQPLEEAQVVAQLAVLGFERLDLRREPLLCGLLGGE